MSDAGQASEEVGRDGPVESRRQRLRRHARRGRLYAIAFVTGVLVVAIVAIVAANTRPVEASWVFGSTRQSLAWIVIVAALLGWLLGIVTSALVRRRSRARS